MNGYVYILKDNTDKFYIGSTTDIDRRLKQHNSGHTKTTNRMGDLHLILIQKYDTLATARRIERKIKKLKRKDYIEKMVKEGYIRLV